MNNSLGNLFQKPKSQKKNASYYRRRGRELLKNKWADAAMAAIVAFLFGVTVMGGINVDVTVFLSTTSMSKLTFAILFGSLALFFIFVSSPLKVGYQRFQLRLLDSGSLTVKQVFSCGRGLYWKSVWLNILNMALTILPSFVMVTGANYFMQKAFKRITVSVLGENGQLVEKLMPDNTFWITFGIACGVCVLSFVWSCFFSYIYRYSYTVLAEYPTVGAVEAMRMSRNMMKGRKWKLFCLDISFIGWLLLGIYTAGIGMLFFVPTREASLVAFYHDAANRDSAKEVEFPSLDFKDYKV